MNMIERMGESSKFGLDMSDDTKVAVDLFNSVKNLISNHFTVLLKLKNYNWKITTTYSRVEGSFLYPYST